MTARIVPMDEWSNVGDILRDHTYIFYKVWSLGIPVFTDKVPTASVGFDKTGTCVEFSFNPLFWDSLDTYQRAFIVAHEALHVILNHGVRSVSASIRELSNIAMDIVVNTMLVDNYGFDRSRLGDFSKLGVWLDTTFPPERIVTYGMNYEYYYTLLERDVKIINIGTLKPMDDHSGLRGQDFGRMFDVGSPDIQNDIKDVKQLDSPCAGTGKGSWSVEKLERVKRKKTWVQLFKDFFKSKREKPDENEQWARLHRRLQGVDSNLLIPSEHHSMERSIPDKIVVWLFLDTSGSCIAMKGSFLRAYRSIPQDRFDIRLFTFDTSVYEVTPSGDGTVRICGGGGTSFYCIEREIKHLMASSKIPYPKLVLVFTDGAGDHVSPMFPERWYWFVTKGYCRDYFPKKSTIIQLSDMVA